jgi:thiamine-phosphate pyrophosphorylase
MPLTSRLCLLFTPSLCAADPWHTLERALAGGVDLVQWRVKERDAAGLRRCQEICRPRGVPVIVNDDVALAVAAGAAGAHVGQDDLPARVARARLKRGQWLGVSTHDLAQIQRAVADGADYLGFGPCFPTATKGYEQGLPSGSLARALAATRLPVFAIGGITAERLALLRKEGCTRIAVSSAILRAADPQAAVRELLAALAGG